MVQGVRRLQRAVHGLLASNRRRVLLLLFFVVALDYAERGLIGAIGPTLKHAFGIGNFRLGMLSTALLFVSAGAAVPLGMLADRARRTLLLAGSFVVWAAAMGALGASTGFWMFFGTSFALGMAAATSGPVIPSLIGDIVPAARRSRALGIVNAGVLIGLGIGYVLPPILSRAASWRWNFWLLAAGGAALALALWRVGEPERVGAEGPEEGGEESLVRRLVRERGVEPSPHGLLEHDPSEMSMWEAAKYTVEVRTDLIVLVARSVGDFFFQAIATFAIVFATGWYGISQGEANLAILVVGIGAVAGVVALSRLSDALLRRGVVNSRILVGSVSYVLSVVALYPAFISRSLSVSIPFFAAGAFFLAGARPSLDAIRVDVLVGRLRGRAESIRQVLRSGAEGLAPVSFGALSAALGGGSLGLERVFLVLLPLLVLNGLILLLALRTYQRDVAAAIVSSQKSPGDHSGTEAR